MSDAQSTDHTSAGASDAAVGDNLAASASSDAVIIVQEPPQESQPSNVTSAPEQLSQLQPLSKRAQKRAAKEAYLREKKLERRQREKAAKKEKKRQLRERRAAGELKDEEEDTESRRASKRARKTEPANPFKARVVVDLGFDSYMTEKEMISMSSQLAYCYSANRRATCPFETLLFTSLEGRLRARLDKENNAGYKRWAGCEWWEESYERLWSDDTTRNPTVEHGTYPENSEERSRTSKDKVVYLTADADEELEELKEGETYILGGIVDRNRHKFLCQKKATSEGIRTARLPIGTYLKEMKTRKVLTVNQVFEILVHWTENRNWKEALYTVMPKRKFAQQSDKPQNRQKSVEEEEPEVDEDNELEEDDSSEGESDRGKRGEKGGVAS